jgi:2-hydroxychromene-2-carboxylate isomerase
MADVDFFWDPVCPWAWVTSRWVTEVASLRPLDVDWRFIALRIVNEERDYEKEFSAGYERGHTAGLELLRIAAAAREQHGRGSLGALYTELGTRIHGQQRRADLQDPDGTQVLAEEALDAAGLPTALAAARTDTSWDDAIRGDTEEALARAGKNLGTPIMTFGPPDGPSFFGPVVSRIPRGDDALALWDHLQYLAAVPGFAELKRSLRERPQLD